jgi:hypothetical protein
MNYFINGVLKQKSNFENCSRVFYSCGRLERGFEPIFGNRKLDQRPPAATDPAALMDPPDAAQKLELSTISTQVHKSSMQDSSVLFFYY